MTDLPKIPPDPIKEMREKMAQELVTCWIKIAKAHGFEAMENQRHQLIAIAEQGREV